MALLDARWRSENGLALAVVLSGLVITGVSAFFMARQINSQADERFALSTRRVADEIQRRFKQSGLGLSGVRAFFASAGSVNRKQFQDYVAAQKLAAEYPGVRGFGLIQHIKRDEQEQMVQAERADGAPDFAIHQLDDKDLGDLLVLRFIEPAAWNQGAQGLDIGSESVRRKAAERAIVTGEPTMSDTIVLVQDNQRTAGALIFVPIYQPGMPLTQAQERRDALIGLLVSPIVISELMQGVSAAEDEAIQFELYDPATLSQPKGELFYTSASPSAAGASGDRVRFQHTQNLSLAQRDIRLRIVGTPHFEAQISYSPLWVLMVAGSIVSILLGLLLRQQASGRRRAEELAQDMTRDLDRLAAVVRHTSNSVCISGSDLRINWINEGFTRISGYSMHDALGKTPAELLGSGKADPLALQTLSEATAAGTSCRVEILNKAKNGRYYWIDTEMQPLRDKQGKLTGFMEIGTDITANKAVEGALRENERLLRLVTENMGGQLAYFDSERHLRFANQANYDFFGGTSASLIGRSFDELISPSQLANVGDAVDRVLTGEPQTYESQTVMTDGQTKNAIVHLVPDLQGTSVRGFVALAVDVTLAKQEAQELARQADTLLRTALEATGLGLVLFDAQERLVFCNENYRRLYEGELNMLVRGNRFGDILQTAATRGLVPEAIGREADWVAERLMRFREASGEHLRQTRDGRSVRMIERRLPDGHFVGLHLDISDLVRATEAAQESARAKGQFLANMSHEIRTPMNAILGLLALLRRTPLGSRQADYAAKTENAAHTMLGLLDDILDFSRVESGKMTLERRPFGLDAMLQDLSVILSAGVGSKPLKVLFDVDPTLPPVVVGDKLRLLQVLINLGANAVKFTEQGEVVVSLRARERRATTVMLQFEIRDTGIGIDTRYHASIFSAFSQAEGSITRRFGGTGLGLSISSKLVQLMGGEIELQSSPGNGSRFGFTIALELPPADAGTAPDAADVEPRTQTLQTFAVDDNTAATVAQTADVEPDDEPHEATTAPVELEQRLAGLRVLLAEDNLVNQEVMRELLHAEGAIVHIAAHGQAALDLLRAHTDTVDVVLMDLQMPVMDGLTAAGHIRSDLGLTGLPIIAMTANAMASDREACLAAGMNDHIGKPFELEKLIAMVRCHCGLDVAAPASDAPTRRDGFMAMEIAAAASGIDLQAAVRRMGGRTDVYLRMLRLFNEAIAQAPQALRAMHKADNADAIAMLLHNLRGQSASLGAARLAGCLAEADRLLRQQPREADNAIVVEQAVRDLQAAQPAVQMLLEALVGNPTVSDAPAEPAMVAAELRRELQQLAKQLRESDMAATDTIQELCQRYGGYPVGRELRVAQDAIDRLEFSRAVQLCNELIEAYPA